MFTITLPFLAKLVPGVFLVWALRTFAPSIVARFNPAAQPLVAALIAVVIDLATGTAPAASIQSLVEAAVAFFATLGLVKGGDLYNGKAATVTTEEKALLEEAKAAIYSGGNTE